MPKYQAIYTLLRQQILDGDLPPGDRLPSQSEMATSFGVTLMTLRQALSALDDDGLVQVSRGRGTYVAENPVDIRLGNLSSFAQQMQAAGIEMVTEVLDISTIAYGEQRRAANALSLGSDLRRVTRRRCVNGEPISLQRSYFDSQLGVLGNGADLPSDSLYGAIEEATGWEVAQAKESIDAVLLSDSDAAALSTKPAHPAILSIRVSINQFGDPFLYDEALLVGGRCTIAADRTSDRLSLNYGMA